MSEADATKIESGIRRFFLKLGGVLAIVLHPCFLFFYCFITLHFLFDPIKFSLIFFELLSSVILFTVIIPALFPIIYAKDAFLKKKKYRPISILITFVCYALCIITLILLSFYQASVSIKIGEFECILLAILMIGLFILFISSFWLKISFHANGVGFLTALCYISAYFWYKFSIEIIFSVLFLFITTSSIILWQRVASRSHTFFEVASGFIVGFFITIVSLYIIVFHSYEFLAN